ncbi:MarR family winged helix-turn-helix transcriptional regulator [Alicyclobacillus fodiniaquatilis]|jgi:DNA-binding MarR family transcriptional regulator|uniref:MarR family winged helix-turn-helix transcriptional regulator n=1 Tax=Alicyclobacillus fodiniaquatilis TaxID=1661150 RepID=A0ABW4JL72_9BACL
MMSLIEEIQHGQDRAIDRISLTVMQQAMVSGKVRPSDIAKTLQVNPSSVTRRVQTLEDEGRVSVVVDPNDHRSCLIDITDKGREELKRLEDAGLDVFSRILEGWSEDEVCTFANLTLRFANSMKNWRLSHPATQESKSTSPRKKRWR